MKNIYIVGDTKGGIISAHLTTESANADIENQKLLDETLNIIDNDYIVVSVPLIQTETPIQTKLNFL